MDKLTGFLYASPSFAEGAGRILDFGNTLARYNISSTPARADRRAMEADWRAVGSDIRQSISKFRSSIESTTPLNGKTSRTEPDDRVIARRSKSVRRTVAKP